MDQARRPRTTDSERTERIRRAVIDAGLELRRRHPWLRHQDLIGATIMLVSLMGMVACALTYASGGMPAWVCVPLVAVFASLIHELEHDLIHYMYFRDRPLLHNLMLGLGWIARPSTINPWIRRRIHLHHHKHSGTPSDVEERGITNGERWGIRRLIMLADGLAAILLRAVGKKSPARALKTIALGLAAYFPLGWLHFGVWWTFLGFHAVDGLARWTGLPIEWSATTVANMQIVDFLAVVLIGPNALRSFCLHFVSSNMHYYGDVEDGNFMQQTQVLNPWWLLPFQLFCFNFGSTHAIHHFVVRDPFYIRQWLAPAAHAVMREQGVRFNDIGTFRRSNRLWA